jgi:hypothetical protein
MLGKLEQEETEQTENFFPPLPPFAPVQAFVMAEHESTPRLLILCKPAIALRRFLDK